MKRIILFCILFIISVGTFAQTESEEQTKKLFCQKWILTHVDLGGGKIPVPAEAGDSFLDFKAEGSVLEIDITGEQKAKWTYDHKVKTITVADKEGTVKYEIIKLNETELIFKSTKEGITMNLIMKKVS